MFDLGNIDEIGEQGSRNKKLNYSNFVMGPKWFGQDCSLVLTGA